MVEKLVGKIRRKQKDLLVGAGIKNGSCLIVGVSGGADSLTLLDSLASFRQDLGINLYGAHVNHGLLGESEENTSLIVKVFNGLNVPYEISRPDTLTYKKIEKLSEEDAARRVRYRFLSNFAIRVGADAIALGHTADDQAETVLLHMLRGSGLVGLAGMALVKRGRIAPGFPSMTVIRPLLETTHQETVEYCRLRSLSVLEDRSNNSVIYLRNQIRHNVLPYLTTFNPQIKNALCRVARISQAQLEHLNSEVENVWSETVKDSEECLIVDKVRFSQLDMAVQSHLVRRVIEEGLGNLFEVESWHIEQIARVLNDARPKAIYLPGGVIFKTSKTGGKLSVSTGTRGSLLLYGDSDS